MNKLVVYYWLRYLLHINETGEEPTMVQSEVEEIESVLATLEDGEHKEEL